MKQEYITFYNNIEHPPEVLYYLITHVNYNPRSLPRLLTGFSYKRLFNHWRASTSEEINNNVYKLLIIL